MFGNRSIGGHPRDLICVLVDAKRPIKQLIYQYKYEYKYEYGYKWKWKWNYDVPIRQSGGDLGSTRVSSPPKPYFPSRR